VSGKIRRNLHRLQVHDNNLRSYVAALLVIVEFTAWLERGVSNNSSIGIAIDFNHLSVARSNMSG
jgi:hypothetical protein